jgi:simple sugar transport system permease protein
MFNIGGQGQYIVGSIMSVWLASAFVGMNGPLHIVLAIVVAALAGALWAGIAGFLKATVGAHEVISTIMLNWIAYWIGSWVFALGGPLQSHANGASVPVSHDIQPNTHLFVFWGNPILQGLHVGFFVALGALVVYWMTLSRTTLGYQVRAVGFNPEAARYGGISVARNYVVAMGIAGAFAGLAGALDILGWEFRLDVNDIQASQIGFIAIAVALLGRNSAIGVFFAALLFGALLNGTSTRHLDPTVFRPDLAGNLTLIIQGLVVLFVGADVLVLWLWNQRRRLRARRVPEATTAASA